MEVDGIEYLDVQQAAVALDVTPGRIRQIISENRVASIKIGQFRLIKKSDVDFLMETPRTVGRPKENKEGENK